MEIRHVALVLFGGSGERFGASEPKQFIALGDRPMLVVTLEGLSACPDIEEIYVVAKAGTVQKTLDVVSHYRIPKIKAIIPGGKTRERSVYEGILYLREIGLPGNALVLIHDGDRPLIDPKIVKGNFDAAYKTGAAVTAIPATDSVILSAYGDKANRYLPRKEIYLAQTPQTFSFSILSSSFEHVAKRNRFDDFTDDASLVKSRGHEIAIVPGSRENVKIATRFDLASYFEGRRHL